MIDIGKFKAWNFCVLKAFTVVEAIRFNVIVKGVNSRIVRKLNPETVRVFLDKLTKEGYLEKRKADKINESIYIKTNKFEELIKEYERLDFFKIENKVITH